MDENRESGHSEMDPEPQSGGQRWLVVAAVVLLGIAAVSFVYGYHQQSLVRQLSAQATSSSAEMNALQTQVNTLTEKLTQLSTPQPAPTPDSPASASGTAPAGATEPASATTSTTKAHSKRPATKRRAAPADSKYNKLQAQLEEQQKQLKVTQDAVEKNRADLESSLSSTRDDLNGSIARTHEELVALEKRGERSYFEFDLSKSKQFSRVGPVTLSLRKADTKHKNYNLAMVVDDDKLEKKNVNLFEPIWIHTENESQPVQIVVNKIDKDFVHGYVSAPKYKPSELASAVTGAAAVTPVSAKTPGTTPNPPDQQQPQPPPPPQPQQPEQPNPF